MKFEIPGLKLDLNKWQFVSELTVISFPYGGSISYCEVE